MDTNKIEVDGMHINADHYASFTQAEAVKRMKADGLTKDDTWAKKAWSEARKKVADATKISEEEQEKRAQAKEAFELEELNRTRTASGVDPVADKQTLAPATSAPPPAAPAKENK